MSSTHQVFIAIIGKLISWLPFSLENIPKFVYQAPVV